nr:MAG TPA: hypothetical protein [Caudoviricetes sp.]
MIYELEQRHFDIFKDEARKWINLFGLKDWEIFFRFEEMEDFDRALCRTNWAGKVCNLALARWHSEERTEGDIRKYAFHEVCELLLTEMERIALDEEIPYTERKGLAEAARHGVIRRLENSVFPLS